jgi:hypothetical protein
MLSDGAKRTSSSERPSGSGPVHRGCRRWSRREWYRPAVSGARLRIVRHPHPSPLPASVTPTSTTRHLTPTGALREPPPHPATSLSPPATTPSTSSPAPNRSNARCATRPSARSANRSTSGRRDRSPWRQFRERTVSMGSDHRCESEDKASRPCEPVAAERDRHSDITAEASILSA